MLLQGVLVCGVSECDEWYASSESPVQSVCVSVGNIVCAGCVLREQVHDRGRTGQEHAADLRCPCMWISECDEWYTSSESLYRVWMKCRNIAVCRLCSSRASARQRKNGLCSSRASARQRKKVRTAADLSRDVCCYKVSLYVELVNVMSGMPAVSHLYRVVFFESKCTTEEERVRNMLQILGRDVCCYKVSLYVELVNVMSGMPAVSHLYRVVFFECKCTTEEERVRNMLQILGRDVCCYKVSLYVELVNVMSGMPAVSHLYRSECTTEEEQVRNMLQILGRDVCCYKVSLYVELVNVMSGMPAVSHLYRVVFFESECTTEEERVRNMLQILGRDVCCYKVSLYVELVNVMSGIPAVSHLYRVVFFESECTTEEERVRNMLQILGRDVCCYKVSLYVELVNVMSGMPAVSHLYRVVFFESECTTEEERVRNMLQIWSGDYEDASPDNFAYLLEGMGLFDAAATLKPSSPYTFIAIEVSSPRTHLHKIQLDTGNGNNDIDSGLQIARVDPSINRAQQGVKCLQNSITVVQIAGQLPVGCNVSCTQITLHATQPCPNIVHATRIVAVLEPLVIVLLAQSQPNLNQLHDGASGNQRFPREPAHSWLMWESNIDDKQDGLQQTANKMDARQQRRWMSAADDDREVEYEKTLPEEQKKRQEVLGDLNVSCVPSRYWWAILSEQSSLLLSEPYFLPLNGWEEEGSSSVVGLVAQRMAGLRRVLVDS
ncbi:hypothetical protein PR048_020745 [Dryococelus australis]|uniref:Uncharacterized protein n=1 Tax=Dryococelus australis TaxID=614101 RepID=A0ABQ9GW95_9NEOP|nr:hypothetical protein PR048_020745 [Dryococelus australis]